MKLIRVEGLKEGVLPHLGEMLADIGYAENPASVLTLTVKKGKETAVVGTYPNYEITYDSLPSLCRSIAGVGGYRETEDRHEKNRFDTLCYMADMSRNAVFTMETAKKMIRLLASLGYNSLMLYTEETYELPGYPRFGYMRGAFTREELKELDDYSFSFGIELIPCIQTLAHLNCFLNWPESGKYLDIDDILLTDTEETNALIEAMIKTCAEVFRSRKILIGMDEAENLGRGKHQTRFGPESANEILLRHLGKVSEITKKYGFTAMMWSDMFFKMQIGHYRSADVHLSEETLAKVPDGVWQVYWDYYTPERDVVENMVAEHARFPGESVFAGGAWKWHDFCPHNFVSEALLPMQTEICSLHGIKHYILTGWADCGAECSQFAVLPILLQTAELAYGAPADRASLEERSAAVFGIGYSDLMKWDLPDWMDGMVWGYRPDDPAKYLFYNDPLERLCDCHYDPDVAPAHYANAAKTLAELADHPRWGYIFNMEAGLCAFLAKKSDLGTRLYRAYKNGDKAALSAIRDEIPGDITLLRDFFEAFRTQWYKENRPFGFNVHEMRIGGLCERLRSVIWRLDRYLSGEDEKIPELEIAPMPLRQGNGDGNYLNLNVWEKIAFSSVLT